MSNALKKTAAVVMALTMVIMAAFTLMPVRAHAASSKITYSVQYVGDKVQLTLTPKKSSNTIYYSTNGKKPTTSSTKYTGTLQTGGKATIKAIEVTKNGKQTASLTITIQARVQTPVVTVKQSSTGLTLLKVTTATPGATIYYTINGTKPTKKSYLYENGKEPIFTEGTVFMFRAFKSGMKSSEVVSYGKLASFNEMSEKDAPAEAAEILKLVNKERTKNGLQPLKLDADIMEAAAIRAKEITTKYGHTRPDGSDFYTVFDEVGLEHKKPGENVGYSSNDTAAHLMELWMDSPKHKANILNESFTRMGVGHCVNDGIGYWVQLFLR